VLATAIANAAPAATLQVPSQYTTIQAAIEAADNYDEILVAPGTYSGSGIAIVDPLGKTLTIRSIAGAEVTTLDGLSQRRGIICYNYDDVTIEGFTVRNCVPVWWPGYEGELGQDAGAGLHSGAASPSVLGCIFESDTQHRNGSPTFQECTWRGVRHEAVHFATPQFTGCRFESGAGFTGSWNAMATFASCEFIDGNDSYQGGWSYAGGAAIKLYLDSGAAINGCHFENNYSATDGGAIMHDGTNGPEGTLSVTNSVFIGNSAVDLGGAIYSGDAALIEDCIFHANQAIGVYGRGGALSLTTGNTVMGCEFVGNTATYEGGTIRFSGYPDLVDSVVSESSLPCISASSGSIDIAGTTFCGHSEADVTEDWNDLGGNEFSADCDFSLTGSCCVNGGCLELSFEDCTTISGAFGGLGSFCAGASCEPDSGGQSECPFDGDADDDVDVYDLLDLLESWGSCP